MEPKRVLHCLTGLGSGGAEALIMTWYRNIDRNKIQFDFLLRSNENIYEEEIKNLGGRVFYVSEYPRYYFKNRKETKQFFKKHGNEFEAIHVHGNALLYVNVFEFAKKAKIKKRVFHSHSTHSKQKLFEILHFINRKRIKYLATDYFACSDEAGKFAFDNLDYRIIKNGIDLDRFNYNEKVRLQIRNELGIDEKFVVGHIGRFLEAKNHEFIVEVFEKVCEKKEDCVLLFAGSGPTEEQIQNMLQEKGLNNCIFLGERKDVEKIYQAMDVFVFPSKYEGFGIAAIEAQTAGLKSLISDTIPKDVLVTDNAIAIPINSSDIWADAILNINTDDRYGYKEQLQNKGYDIIDCISCIEEYYLK